MAASDTIGQFGETFGSLGGILTGLAFWILLALLMVGIVGGIIMYVRYRRKFDITVKIISKRAGENKVLFDKGAILRDKKNKTDFLKLQKAKMEIELPKFDIFYHTNKGDYVEMLRDSERSFRFLTPTQIDKTYMLSRDGKVYPFADVKQKQIENDLSWIVGRERINKKLIDPESFIMKLLEYAPQILSGVISMMVLWMVLRYAPELMASMEKFAKTITSAQAQEPEIIGGFILALLPKWARKGGKKLGISKPLTNIRSKPVSVEMLTKPNGAVVGSNPTPSTKKMKDKEILKEMEESYSKWKENQ